MGNQWRNSTYPRGKFGNIEVKLHHMDLPKASETEYISYDPEEWIVEVTETPSEFGAIISVAEVIERPNQNP